MKKISFFLVHVVFFLFSILPSGRALADIADYFPSLTGHIIDQANILSPQTRQEFEKTLAEHEAQTSNQIVALTLLSLHGYPIEQFSLELGRHWQLGQGKKNNGILLLVAPRERDVRIEVGYGLEGALTDAIAHDIIQSDLVPAFRAGQYEEGIRQALHSILQAVAGEYVLPKTEDILTEDEYTGIGVAFTVFLVTIFLGPFLNSRGWLTPLGKILTGLALSCLTGALLCYPWIRYVLSASSSLAVSSFLGVVTFILFFYLTRNTADSSSVSSYSSTSRSYRNKSSRRGSSSRRGGGYSGGGGSFGGGGASGKW